MYIVLRSNLMAKIFIQWIQLHSYHVSGRTFIQYIFYLLTLAIHRQGSVAIPGSIRARAYGMAVAVYGVSTRLCAPDCGQYLVLEPKEKSIAEF